MATRAQLEAEAYRRGVMPPERRAVYEEAVRRGLVRDDYASGRRDARSAVGRASALAARVNAAIPGFDEATAGLTAGIKAATGRGNFRDNWKAERAWQQGMMDQARADAPVAAETATGIGYAIQAVPALFSGGATVAPQTGNLFARLGAGTARNATAGAAYGFGNVFADQGSLSERVDAANRSIIPGAVAGAVAPAIIAAPGAAKRGAEIALDKSGAGRAVTRAVNTGVSKARGRGFLDPRQEAMARLGEALKADGLSPQQITAALNEWSRVGGPSPTFMDLVAINGGGQRTMSLIRGSAMSGGGRDVASRYGNQVAVDLQDEAIARTRQLTPEGRPAANVADEIRSSRARLADEQYRGPYEAQVPVTREMTEVLTDAPGKSALRQARADALERRDMARVAEIDRLLAAEPVPANPYEWYRPAPQTVSGATLDRTQIALRERGERLSRAGNNSRAGGARNRRSVINEELDRVPDLQEARAAYRDASRQLEGVESVGPRVLTAPADEYAASVAALGEGARSPAQVGAARAIEDAIGRPAEGSTGVLNRVATATNPGRNLSATFGDDAASNYRQSIGQMVDQVQNARFINPNTGSATAGRLADQSLVESLPPASLSPLAWTRYLADKVQRGATLTDAERQIIVEIATTRGRVPPELDQVFMPASPRPPLPEYGPMNVFAAPAASYENRR